MQQPLPQPQDLGTQDLEKGMRPSRAFDFRTIAVNAVLILLLFNSVGLMRWTQTLPSDALNIWLAERAADWDRLMHVSPAEVFERVKALLGGAQP